MKGFKIMKELISKSKKYFIDSDYRFIINSRFGLYDNWDDERYLKRQYKALMKTELNLDDPQTFNEKLQWLKLNYRDPFLTIAVDKYEAKNYVANKIGEKFIVPTYGVWPCFDDIDFAKLPEKFVLKCTHNSGGIVICESKGDFDLKKAKGKLNKSLRRNYYYLSREWPYKNVKPQIIAEQYLSKSEGENLYDYKLMCFNGKVQLVLVCSDRFLDNGLCEDFYDVEWNHLPISRPNVPNSTKPIKKPSSLLKMIDLAEVLAKDIPFVRVDFYDVNGNIYFGELTFYPAYGMKPFVPSEWDYKLGNLLYLPH